RESDNSIRWPPHWMISSARASSDGGIVRPSAVEVLRLTTSSKVVGRSIGSSPGLAPFSTRPANDPRRCQPSTRLGPYAMRHPLRRFRETSTQSEDDEWWKASPIVLHYWTREARRGSPWHRHGTSRPPRRRS